MRYPMEGLAKGRKPGLWAGRAVGPQARARTWRTGPLAAFLWVRQFWGGEIVGKGGSSGV